MSEKDNKERLASFTNSYSKMIATSETSYNEGTFTRYRIKRFKKYTPEEIEKIIGPPLSGRRRE